MGLFSELLDGGKGSVYPSAFPDPAEDLPATDVEQTAVLAGGCFWCVEAVYKDLDGVLAVTSGYSGDSEASADYHSVCSGTTNHAEVVSVRYDPSRVTYGQVLKIFFAIAHDPTQVDRQGGDVGRQYRSAIFCADEDQKRVAEAYIRQLNAAGVFKKPIATTLEPLAAFFEAEGYHQDYAARNPANPYIAYNAMPKVQKLHKYFGDRVKKA